MGFREVSSLDAETTIKLGGADKKTGKKNPTTTEGYYLGTRNVPGGKYGDSKIHFLQTPNGNVGVWGKTDMDRKLTAISPGTMVRVSHTGMRPTKAGDMHTYKVEHDPDNTIEVDAAAFAPSTEVKSTGSGYEPGYDDESNDEFDNDVEEYKAVEQPVLSKKTPAQVKADFQAALKRGK